MTLLGFSRFGGLDGFLEEAERFHGFRSPGLVVAGFMVDYAVEELGGERALKAVAETRSCLTDAVQLLARCTTGNGRLRIIEAGRFALTLYDRDTLEGVRVFVDPDKLERFPEVDKWFYRKVKKSDQPLEVLLPEIIATGRAILTLHHINVAPELARKHHAPPRKTCAICQEPYRDDHPLTCKICREPYFTDSSSSERQPPKRAAKDPILLLRSHWIVRIDPAKCSLCEVCVHHCPTAALRSEQTGDKLALIFQPRLCHGCQELKSCSDLCPEQAISLIEAECLPLGSADILLVRGHLLQCSYCGDYFAPMRKLEAIATKRDADREQLNAFCPICRRTQLVVDFIEEKREPHGPAKYRSGKDILRRARIAIEEASDDV